MERGHDRGDLAHEFRRVEAILDLRQSHARIRDLGAAIRRHPQQHLDDLVLKFAADPADHPEVEQHHLGLVVFEIAHEDIAGMRIGMPDSVDADLLEIRAGERGGEVGVVVIDDLQRRQLRNLAAAHQLRRQHARGGHVVDDRRDRDLRELGEVAAKDLGVPRLLLRYPKR